MAEMNCFCWVPVFVFLQFLHVTRFWDFLTLVFSVSKTPYSPYFASLPYVSGFPLISFHPTLFIVPSISITRNALLSSFWNIMEGSWHLQEDSFYRIQITIILIKIRGMGTTEREIKPLSFSWYADVYYN